MANYSSKYDFAIIGSGLSALGALLAFKEFPVKYRILIVCDSGQMSRDHNPMHYKIWSEVNFSGEFSLSKTGFEVVGSSVKTNISAEAISCFGGLANFWGRQCYFSDVKEDIDWFPGDRASYIAACEKISLYLKIAKREGGADLLTGYSLDGLSFRSIQEVVRYLADSLNCDIVNDKMIGYRKGSSELVLKCEKFEYRSENIILCAGVIQSGCILANSTGLNSFRFSEQATNAGVVISSVQGQKGFGDEIGITRDEIGITIASAFGERSGDGCLRGHLCKYMFNRDMREAFCYEINRIIFGSSTILRKTIMNGEFLLRPFSDIVTPYQAWYPNDHRSFEVYHKCRSIKLLSEDVTPVRLKRDFISNAFFGKGITIPLGMSRPLEGFHYYNLRFHDDKGEKSLSRNELESTMGAKSVINPYYMASRFGVRPSSINNTVGTYHAVKGKLS